MKKCITPTGREPGFLNQIERKHEDSPIAKTSGKLVSARNYVTKQIADITFATVQGFKRPAPSRLRLRAYMNYAVLN